MMFRIAAAVTILASATVALAQDPTTTLPESYKVLLDNDYVKVVQVHYDAGAKLAAHTHPGGTTLYVYLNDSEGVVFTHNGNNNRAVTRPPVKSGAIRIAAGPEEHHTVENTSATATDFLRVWFKTDNGGVDNLRQRLAPTDVDFANKQMRISRLRVKPGQVLGIETRKNPALRIAIREGVKQWATPPADFVRWLDKDTTEDFRVTGDFPVDIVKIEFLTKPK